jgi:hypothetical protein
VEDISLETIESLKKKHESIKSEMIQTIEAINLLDLKYKELEVQLYKIEEEYIIEMKKIV